jgi:5-methylcytosine-specific restriction endonuclease McrA
MQPTQRSRQLEAVWKATHRDYKGTLPDGTRTILVCRAGSTQICPLQNLTDREIADRLPRERAAA